MRGAEKHRQWHQQVPPLPVRVVLPPTFPGGQSTKVWLPYHRWVAQGCPTTERTAACQPADGCDRW